jgi:hypothetical protein
MALTYEEIAEALESATAGFESLFSDDIADAKGVFSKHESPLHLLGLGVCAFLEASLGMEVQHIREPCQNQRYLTPLPV